MCLQMGELSFDFAEGLVVGLGIDGKEKRILAAKWQEFTKNAFTFTVRPAQNVESHVSRAMGFKDCGCYLDWDPLEGVFLQHASYPESCISTVVACAAVLLQFSLADRSDCM